jgi:hypothetical protein
MADAVFMHLPEMDPPVNIAAAVAQQIAEEAPAERSRGWVWGSLAALAAILAAMWSFGITPAVLWNSPALTAIVAPLAGTVAGWLRPITLPLQALSPAYGVIAAGLLVIVALEAAMVAFWMKRPGGRVAGQAGQA